MTDYTTNTTNDVDDDFDDIPQEFLCPLTLQLFENPLVNMYGMNYERSAIVEWLDRGNQVCPLTRRPLSLSGLIHNHALKTRILVWKAEQQEQRASASAAVDKNNSKEQCCALAQPQDCFLKQVGFFTAEQMDQELQRRRQQDKKSSSSRRSATTTTTATTTTSSTTSDSSTRRIRRNWLFSRRKTGRSSMHTTAWYCTVSIHNGLVGTILKSKRRVCSTTNLIE